MVSMMGAAVAESPSPMCQPSPAVLSLLSLSQEVPLSSLAQTCNYSPLPFLLLYPIPPTLWHPPL